MNKKIKTALAAVLAVCSLMNLTGCSENRERTLSVTDSSVKPSDGDNISESDSDNSDMENSGGSDTSNSNTSEQNTNASDTGNSNADASNTGESDTSSSQSGTSDSQSGAEVIKTQYSPIKLSDNNTINSIRLFDLISADKENAMFSPISLNMALGLIEAGAEGDTKTALDAYLRTENFPDLAEKYLEFIGDNRNREERVYSEFEKIPASYLEIANSVWADNALPLKENYKNITAKKFGAEIENLDFAQKESTLKRINGWVSDKTHKMIPTILSDYDANTMAVLINTVYFESAWADKWYIDESKTESFTLPDGTSKQIPLMYNGGDSYFENDKAAAFGCRYLNGLEFIGILPKDTGEFTLESLDIPSLLESKNGAANYDIDAVMPRLDFETELPLNDALAAAGLENIFDKDKADFSGISDVPLWVSQVLQKTKLELDENGTKAAAATVIAMAGNAMPMPKERKTVRLDRPFAFMIYDSAEDQILFLGKVTEP